LRRSATNSSIAACNTRALEALVEDRAGRPDKWVAQAVLAIAGLLADEHQRSGHGALAHHRLGGPLPQVARSALLNRGAKARDASPAGDRRRGAFRQRAHRSSAFVPAP
jgi:hypothetical protein